MKLKIKVRKLYPGVKLPEVIKKGEWVDLRSSSVVHLNAPQAGTLKTHKVNGENVSHRDVSFDYELISLGVSMSLPKGFEAVIAPRSSTFRNFGIIQANSIGVVDNSYCGDHDIWKMPVIALRDTTIESGDRICQFRIQLSQKANLWQKLRWFLSSGIKFKEVEFLWRRNRGGNGSTGIK